MGSKQSLEGTNNLTSFENLIPIGQEEVLNKVTHFYFLKCAYKFWYVIISILNKFNSMILKQFNNRLKITTIQ